MVKVAPKKQTQAYWTVGVGNTVLNKQFKNLKLQIKYCIDWAKNPYSHHTHYATPLLQPNQNGKYNLSVYLIENDIISKEYKIAVDNNNQTQYYVIGRKKFKIDYKTGKL